MLALKKYTALIFVAIFLCAAISPAFSEGDLQVVDAPLSEEFLQYNPAKNSGKGDPAILGDTGSESEIKYSGGYVPSPIDRSHLKNNPPQKNRNNGDNVGESTIPTTYDLRSVNSKSYLPAIRNQGSYGTCWAHAALGSMESYYLMKSLSGMTLDSNNEPNLSELHMAWFVYKDPKEGHAFSIRDGSFSGGTVFGQGGNADKSIAYMSRLAGPAIESDLPYTSIDSTVEGMNTITGGKHPESYDLALRLHDAYQLGDMTEELRNTVKELIMNNGAVQISYYSQQTVATSSSGTGDSTSSPYYRKDTNSPFTYYLADTTSSNHAVLVVGWDDDFATDNFNPTTGQPSNKGAWLVRNSWGSNWGDSGYFWMSYEQNIKNVTAYVADTVPDGTTVYYHDALGHCSDFRYTYTSSNAIAPGWAANVFKAEGENQAISEVSFFTTENNAAYDIYVFKLGTEKPSAFSVTAGNAATNQTGEATYAGYHVIALEKKVALDDGEYFAVVVNTKNTSTDNIAVEQAVNYEGGASYASPVINAGESYFAGSDSFPSSWTDGSTMTSPRNACIKAFTVQLVQINETLFPDSNFRTYVATFDTNNDGYLSESEIATVTSITFTDSQTAITNLTGIKYFTALTALDVSKLTGLTELDVSDLPKLASLILGTNDVIALLNVSGTALTTLDISGCPQLNLSNITRDSTTTVPRVTPEFKAASLILSGQIGVNFYVYFPDSVAPTTNTSMAFNIRGNTPHAAQPYDATFSSEIDGVTCYGFTCRINSAQMADPITATLTFGDNQTLTMEYSAKDYLTLGLSSSEYDETTQKLFKAIWNYGHYVQPMLSKANGWDIGDKYLEMPALDGATLTDVDAVKTAVSEYKATITSSDPNFGTLSISLLLESETQINIYLKPKNSLSDTVYAAFDDGNKYKVTRISEGTHAGEYLIESNSIPAHKLGTPQKLRIEAGNSWIQIENLSAMSYVRNLLNSSTASDADKNACAALYDYFKAEEAYRAAQNQ